MKKLVLVDGSSYLYRAFHAMPDLRSKTGQPTGAIYGVVNMLRRLQKDYPADYSVCVFDAKGKTFRDDLYPQYKAHRPPMPDDLRPQIEPLHDIIRAMGFPLLMEDGVEADDVIGTLARKGAALGMEVIVSTGDKDMAQLVDQHVRLVNTMTNEVLDEAGVLAKFGVPPDRIIDYLTLIGDTVDNVPGVTKCGPKTAVKWLTEFGDLATIMARADEIGGVVGQNLRDALDWLPMGRQLITIKCDVPLQHDWPELENKPVEKNTLLGLFRQCDFKTWSRELEEAGAVMDGSPTAVVPQGEVGETADLFGSSAPVAAAVPEAPKERRYETILTEAQLQHWLQKITTARLTAVDTETTGLDGMTAQIVGISLSVTPYEAAYLPLGHDYPGAPAQLPLQHVLDTLRPWLEGAQYPKAGQNLKYDRHIFANYGIHLAGVAEDSMLQSYVLTSYEPHNMDDLAAKYLDETTIKYEELCGKGAKQIPFTQVSIDDATNYAAEDADITLRLVQHFQPKLAAEKQLDYVYRELELPVADILCRIERNGVLLDSSKLARQSHELGARLLELEQQAYALAGQPFNLNSPKQLQEILFTKLGIPTKDVKKTASGGFSTDEEVLQKLALDYPLPKLLLENRTLSKLKSTYTDKLPLMVNQTTGRVHTNYAQAVAVTGRLSSNEPNLQNIPVRTTEGRRIREAFIAPAGHHLVSADYSQIELRIMAHLSEDAGLLRAFSEGLDVHRATASEVFGVAPADVTSDQRRYAKTINFGLIYGMSAFGLASQLEIDRATAQGFIERYFQRYPGVKDYMERTRHAAKDQGYVETVFGRRLWLPEIKAANPMRRQGAERAAINAPMQGTAADLIKLAMIAVDKWITDEKLGSKLVMQVHDELVLEVPDAEIDLVKVRLPELMAGVAQLRVPLLAEVGVGENWEAAH
ncbi:DNA polymerase I [Leeia oryzae]|uniref:DNA polymerase I n=1 Tax=Leeia oryzae TaxID=356662 RepID=UPI00036EF29E|nr:DNA polymerase I [Leeia oryzae]